LINVPVEEDNEKRKRYGHAASTWEGMLVIVGGSKRFNKAAKIRECLTDVQVYNPNASQWTELQCTGVALEPRRHHVGCVVGRYLIVHGGISTFGNYLSSMAGLLLGRDPGKDWRQKTYKWFEIKALGTKPKKVAYHAMQLVLQRERYRGLLPMDLFSLPEMRGLSYRVFV
jgi:N-acetylneuraminic acid mutarotase